MNIYNEKNSEGLKIFVEIGGETKEYKFSSEVIESVKDIDLYCIQQTDKIRNELKEFYFPVSPGKRSKLMNHIVGSLKDYHRTLMSPVEYKFVR